MYARKNCKFCCSDKKEKIVVVVSPEDECKAREYIHVNYADFLMQGISDARIVRETGVPSEAALAALNKFSEKEKPFAPIIEYQSGERFVCRDYSGKLSYES